MSILREQRGRITVLTIDRPEVKNALDIETSRELAHHFREFRDDPESWVAVLTGSGNDAFCAGADLKRIGDYYESVLPVERRHRGEIEPGIGGITRNLPIWKPIIAAINGHCLAGGLEIALACDIRIAEPHATFGLTEVKWGIIPGAGGTQRLPRLIGIPKALDLILTGRRISAEEALQAGLISRLTPKGQVLPTAIEVAETICENAPLAVRAAKEAVIRGMDLNLDEGLRLEQFLAEPLRRTEDAREGPKAFAEKRKPDFKGC
ncbi:MAG: enoyl-CoA hydratase/isomerase family protein [bacterium]